MPFFDGIAKKPDKKSVAARPDLEELSKPVPQLGSRKVIDSLRLKKIKRVRPKYSGSATKVRLTKLKSGKRPIFLTAGVIIIAISSLCLALLDTKLWAAFQLYRSLRSENILIGFQNSAELRPTGGFWGSFGIWEIGKNASDSALVFETNPYKNNNKMMSETKVEPPKPMKETWPDNPQGFVNANWSFDYPQAAKTLSWYFGQGWNTEVNGVSAISSLAIIDLLKLTGPIYASDGTEINSDNFTEVMSQKIDTDYWLSPSNVQINEPKTILKDIAPQLIDKTKKLPVMTLYKFLKKQIKEGRVLCYFESQSQEKICEKLGIDGKSKSYEVDYLSINNTNLNGGKTSLNINQSVAYKLDRTEDKILATLEIKRIYQDNLWPKILNRNYTRVIVPLGSKLILAKSDGEDIEKTVDKTEEVGKTVFGFWLSVAPGETKTAEISYFLPAKFDKAEDYRLILQKQPGTLPEELDITLFDKKIYSGTFNNNALVLK